jgi:hypothetical protein
MEDASFDPLTRGVAGIITRRRMLGQLGALPLAGFLVAAGAEQGHATRPRHGRHAGHRPSKDKENRTGERNGDNQSRTSDQCHPQEPGCGLPCGGTFCSAATQICTGDAICMPCDVCPTCTHSGVQSAIDAASPGATIYICSGTYTRTKTQGAAADINKNLTLIGSESGMQTVQNLPRCTRRVGLYRHCPSTIGRARHPQKPHHHRRGEL